MRLRFAIAGTMAILLAVGVGWRYCRTELQHGENDTRQTEDIVHRNYNHGYDEIQYFPMTDNNKLRQETEALKEARRQVKLLQEENGSAR